jgi:predicted dehydrogenase
MVTEGVHPYLSAWWPPGHIIGYEHEFHHAVVDFMDAVENNKVIEPNFEDGLKEMQVIEAGKKSADTGQKVQIPE